MRDCAYFETLLSAALDDELNEAESTELTAHLACCESCRACRDAYENIHAALDGALDDVPEGFTASVMEAVRAEAGNTAGRRKSLFLKRLPSGLGLAAAAAVLVFLLPRIMPVTGDAPASAIPELQSVADAADTDFGKAALFSIESGEDAAGGLLSDGQSAPDPSAEASGENIYAAVTGDAGHTENIKETSTPAATEAPISAAGTEGIDASQSIAGAPDDAEIPAFLLPYLSEDKTYACLSASLYEALLADLEAQAFEIEQEPTSGLAAYTVRYGEDQRILLVIVGDDEPQG